MRFSFFEVAEPIAGQGGPLKIRFDKAAAALAKLFGERWVADQSEDGVGKCLRIAGLHDDSCLGAANEIGGFAFADKKERLGATENRENFGRPGAFVGWNIDERSQAAERDRIVGGDLLERDGIEERNICEFQSFLQAE